MIPITQIGLLFVAQESVYGFAEGYDNPLPTVGDSLTWQVLSEAVDRKLMDGTLDQVAGYNAQAHVQLSFQYELRGNRIDGEEGDVTWGDFNLPHELDALLQSANLTPIYTPEASAPPFHTRDGFVTYVSTPFQATEVGVSCYWFTAGKKHLLTGGKTTFKLIAEAGKMPVLEFTVTGKYESITDEDLPTGVTFLPTKPPLVEGSVFTIGGRQPILSKLEYELGNQIGLRKSITDANGIAGFTITGFNPKGTVDPEAESEIGIPFWAEWKNSTLNTIVATFGTESGNQITVTIESTEAKAINYGDREGVRIHQVSFNNAKAAALSSGSIFSLKFH